MAHDRQPEKYQNKRPSDPSHPDELRQLTMSESKPKKGKSNCFSISSISFALQSFSLLFIGSFILSICSSVYQSVYWYPSPSYPILPCPILSQSTLSYPILPCPILSQSTLSYPIISYPSPSYPILTCPIPLHPILACPIPVHPILSYHILSQSILSYPNPTYPTLSQSILSYPVLPYPSPSYPSLSISCPFPSNSLSLSLTFKLSNCIRTPRTST